MKSSIVKCAVISLGILLTGCAGTNFVRVADDAIAQPIKEKIITHPIVLLVDEQPIMAEAMMRILKDAKDIEFHYCQDVSQAIKQANEIKPTVIFQELSMSNMDGLKLIKDFRENENTSITPVVILTSKNNPKDKSRAFEMGASDYLIKIPDGIEMAARIRAYTKMYLLQLKRDHELLEMREKLKQFQ